ncbi:hypothetical protein I7I48_02117 [Histoplasma ohiense]|nr:hypothetical protein I7I48_02117 [Histoplasma ohiense (nom. inval.)]
MLAANTWTFFFSCAWRSPPGKIRQQLCASNKVPNSVSHDRLSIRSYSRPCISYVYTFFFLCPPTSTLNLTML